MEEAKPIRRINLENASFIILTVFVFLLPLFFIPSVTVPFFLGKSLFAIIGVAALLVIWVIRRLQYGDVSVPSYKNVLILAFTALPVIYLLASLFSVSPGKSLLGLVVEPGTFGFMLMAYLATLLVAHIVTTRTRSLYLYLAFLAGFAVLALYHLIRLVFGPQVLSFGVFTTVGSSPVGGWNDLGIFFGLAAILSFITLELLPMDKLWRIVLYVTLAVSLFFLSIINFSLIWITLGILSLVIFIYNFSVHATNQEEGKARHIPVLSLVIMLISLVFILMVYNNTNVYSLLSNEPFNVGFLRRFNIVNVEARPSWGSTIDISKKILSDRPILGAGPNRFSYEWLKFKPDSVNSTIFWNSEFNSGVGFVPSTLITTGVLGFLAWLVFLGSFVWMGFTMLLKSTKDQFGRYALASSFLSALFLWIFSIIYVPSTVTFLYAFIFTGVFLGVLSRSEKMKFINLTFIKDARAAFASVLVLIVILIGAIFSGYLIFRKSVSTIYAQQAQVAFAQGNIQQAATNLQRALSFSQSDAYYRGLAQIELYNLNAVVSQQNVSAETLQAQVQIVLNNALAYAEQAISIDEANYQNWIAKGLIYESIIPLGIQDAYEQATAMYSKALELNPKSPEIELIFARLELAKGNIDPAKEYIRKAVQKKGDYIDAYYLMTQILLAQNDRKGAIATLEQAALVSQGNPNVFYDLGLLRSADANVQGAAAAFEQAVILNPQFANAKYMLALAYNELGRRDEAILLLEDVLKTNEDNADLKAAIEQLKAGVTPPATPIDEADEETEETTDEATTTP